MINNERNTIYIHYGDHSYRDWEKHKGSYKDREFVIITTTKGREILAFRENVFIDEHKPRVTGEINIMASTTDLSRLPHHTVQLKRGLLRDYIN